MKKPYFLFSLAVMCSFVLLCTAFAGKRLSSAPGSNAGSGVYTTFLFYQEPPDKLIIDCGQQRCPERLLTALIPRRPGCICKPDFVYKQGNEIRLMYKDTRSAKGVSVLLTETKMSSQFTNMLNQSKDKKIFVNGSGAQLKGNVWQLKTL